MGQDDAKDMTASANASCRLDARNRAEVDLGFGSRSALQPTKGQRLAGSLQAANEATHAVILAGKVVLDDQVLVDALSGQPQFQLAGDDTPKGLAQARLRMTAQTIRCRG